MGGERQTYLVKANVDIRVVVQFLGLLGDPINKCDGLREALKLELTANGLPALRPCRYSFQAGNDCFFS